MTRQEFKKIATLRLIEAESLLHQNHYDGSCYLAGYCLEMALKAVICRRMEKDDFFEILKSESVRSFKIHNLTELVILAGLQKRYEDLKAINPDFEYNWVVFRDKIRWSEQLRYQTGFTKSDAESMLNAINDPQNGILKWLKKYW
jgi:HEPN domain-containing protein